MHLIRRWLTFAALLLGGGCGPDPSAGTSIRVDPPAVHLQAWAGGVIPDEANVTVTFAGDGLAWGTTGERAAELPAWLSLRHGGAVDTEDGAHAVTFMVGATTTSLAPGAYPFALRFLTGHGDLAAPRDVSHADLELRYDVLAAPP